MAVGYFVILLFVGGMAGFAWCLERITPQAGYTELRDHDFELV